MNLSQYLPRVIVEYLHERELDSGGKERALNLVPPEGQQKHAVILFADVSGFTKMTERLSKYGDKEDEKLGTETLAKELNGYMNRIVMDVITAGGDVLKFAGDAMIAAFFTKNAYAPDEEEVAELCNRAIKTCIYMQRKKEIHKYFFSRKFLPGENMTEDESNLRDNIALYMGDNLIDARTNNKIYLRVKFGIGLGKINIVHLGGSSDNAQDHRYEYVAVGPGLQEAYNAEKYCLPGEIVVSRSVWKTVKAAANKEKSKRVWRDDVAKLVKGNRPFKREKIGPHRNTQFYKIPIDKSVERQKNRTRLQYPHVQEASLMSYVPLASLPYLEQDQQKSIEFWGNELRRVTTLFIQLGLSDKLLEELTESNPDAMGKLQNIFKRLQEDTYRLMGTINKFLIDDKGTTMIVVFGLPPFAHDDDINRGVLCAKAILNSLREEGLKGHIGISTGVSFCGVVGGSTQTRREYSVIGNSINLAARLMSKAKEDNINQDLKTPSLFIDKKTKIGISSDELHLEFKEERAELKGFDKGVKVYKWDGQIRELTQVVLSSQAKMRFAFFFMKEKSEEKGLGVTTKYTIAFNEQDTASDIKDKVLEKMGEKETDAGSKKDLVWYNQGNPEMAIQPPEHLNDSENIAQLQELAGRKVLWFSLADRPPNRKASPPLKSHTNYINVIPKSTIKESSDIQDTFSVIGALEKLKSSRLGLDQKSKLSITILQGTYGVGRSYAMSTVFDTKQQDGIEIVSTKADPFLEKDEELCSVWKDVLKQLLISRKSVNDEDNIARILKKGVRKCLSSRYIPPKMTSADKNYHTPELQQIDLLLSFLDMNQQKWNDCVDKIVCDVADMEQILLKDNSLDAAFKDELGAVFQIVDKLPIENLVQLICGLITGLAEESEVPLFIIIDHSEYMDPFSWLVLTELVDWWSFANLSIVLSLRKSVATSHNMPENESSTTEGFQLAKNASNSKQHAFSHMSTHGALFQSMRSTRLIQNTKKDNNHMEYRKADDIDAIENKYPYLHRVNDRSVLLKKLEDIKRPKAVRFIEVREDRKYTKTIVSNLLKVNPDSVDPELVDLLERKASGVPVIIRDALKYYLDRQVITFDIGEVDGRIENRMILDHEKFERVKNNVPQSVEAIAGMILDTLSITGQIALKVASFLEERFTLNMVRAIFEDYHVSSEGMKDKLDYEWGILVLTRTIIPLEGEKPKKKKRLSFIGTKKPKQSEQLYSFCYGWMRDSIKRRLLKDQKGKINNARKNHLQTLL